MTRVGAIDIGTNSTRLLIADVESHRLDDIDRRSTVTRLGEGVDSARVLLPEPIARTRVVLSEYRRAIDAAGAERTLAVATSAVRDAANGQVFLEQIGASYGFVTRVLSGEEEARLTTRGVGAMGAGTLLVDIGGGSTELIAGDLRASLDIGSVRLTERFLQTDPPTAAELAAAAEYVRGLLPDLRANDAIGVAGTVTQLHELIGELTLASVERAFEWLAAVTSTERACIPRMDPLRAPVILGGVIVVLEVLRRYGLDELAWSRRDLLDGVALEAAEML
jgi:exopolyphosphatase/guanosine-5'-triphosphate,3'-diphosphate pyrophosphatase